MEGKYGTCDVMCELGELMIKWRGDMKPHVVDAFISKLIPITTMNSVLNRIGNDWVDTTMQNLIQDMAQAVEDDVNMNLSNCLNYWINTDKDIYYMSIVYNGATGDQTSFSTQLYNMLVSKFGHIGISMGEEIGYKSSCYPADTKRFGNSRCYVFQEINATYDVFKDLLTEENPGIEKYTKLLYRKLEWLLDVQERFVTLERQVVKRHIVIRRGWRSIILQIGLNLATVIS